jgi:hypothetical protein
MQPNWRKSTFSGENGNCVEAASSAPAILVRDTADRTGSMLCVSSAAWREFTLSLQFPAA